MAKRSERSGPFPSTKKHIARQEREHRQRRIILISSIVVVIIAVALVAAGIVQFTIVQPNQPVAIVENEEISTREWQTQTQYYRYSIIRNIENTLQFAALLGDDPNSLASITGQIQPLLNQLDPPITAGQATLDSMIDNLLIQQEAQRRDITISEDEIESEVQAAFGYYPEGTPTPIPTSEPVPTSTLSSLQKTLIPPTSTPTQSPTPEVLEPSPTPTVMLSPTASPTIAPTATPYTLEGYQTFSRETLDSIEEIYGISQETIREGLRYTIITQLYREKLLEDMTGDLACSEPQVWARHILVESEETAQVVLERLDEGENFCDIAAELSTDTSNKDRCGDLGWFGEGRMVAEFEQAAFALEVGEISEPVESQFGWHIVQSLGNEERTLSNAECQQRNEQIFQDWLTETRTSSDIEIKEYWIERVPNEPALPLQTQLVIQQLLENSVQQNTDIEP